MTENTEVTLALEPQDDGGEYTAEMQAHVEAVMAENGYAVEWMTAQEVDEYRKLHPGEMVVTANTMPESDWEALNDATIDAWGLA